MNPEVAETSVAPSGRPVGISPDSGTQAGVAAWPGQARRHNARDGGIQGTVRLQRHRALCESGGLPMT